MKQSFGRIALLFAAAAGLADGAMAGVTSQPQTVTAYPDKDLYIPLKLQTSAGESIAGINGQMQFDPAYFGNPVVQLGEGAVGFIALGHSPSPGKLRFVVYSDPTQPVDLVSPTMYVKLTAAASLPVDGSTTIAFLNGPIDPGNPDKPGESAASTTAGVSIPSVFFTTVQVALNKNAAADWTLYR